jgi:tetratricopeptide (TPR) repeat protein
VTDDRRTRAALQKIIKEYGRDVLQDPRRVEGLLRDLAPNAKRDTFLLVQGLRIGLVDALLAGTATPEVLAARWSNVLQEELGVTAEAAGWVVARWSEAVLPPRPATPVVELTESQVLRLRGEFHRKRRDFRAALRDLNESLALAPSDAEALLHRGDVFRELGNMQRARADLDRSIAILPTARAYAARSLLNSATGSAELARRDMAAALAMDPEKKFEEWLPRV